MLHLFADNKPRGDVRGLTKLRVMHIQGLKKKNRNSKTKKIINKNKPKNQTFVCLSLQED